jgi:hypothetical protein
MSIYYGGDAVDIEAVVCAVLRTRRKEFRKNRRCLVGTAAEKERYAKRSYTEVVKIKE